MAENVVYADKNVKAITSIPGWLESLTGSGELRGTAAAYAYVPLIYRALRLRCDNLSSVDIALENNKVEVEWENLFPDSDLQGLIWRTEAALLLRGAAFWLKLKNRAGKVIGLKWINPFHVQVQYVPSVKDRDGNIVTPGYKLFLIFTPDGEISNTYTEDDIVYFNEFNPTDDVQPGPGAAEVCLESAGLRRYASRFASKFFEGGAMPVVLLGIPANTSDPERARVESWFKRFMSSVSNAWKVLAVKSGMLDPKILTPPMKDLVIPELNKLALEDISAGFGIRKSILGDPANYATSVEDWDSFWKTTIRPRGRLYEGVINRQLFNGTGIRLKFAFDQLDVFQKDEAERAGSLKQMTDAGMPLLVAMELLGYELTDAQRAMIEKEQNPEPSPTPVIVPAQPVPPAADPQPADPVAAELVRWQRKALKWMQVHGTACPPFESDIVPPALRGAVRGALESAASECDIQAVFADALTWRSYP